MELKIFLIDIVANTGINIPEMIDYTHVGLFKKVNESKGNIDSDEFFLNLENGIFSDLIVKQSYVYDYDALTNLYSGYHTTVEWLNIDESIGHTKAYHRLFKPFESVDYGIVKRNRVLSNAKLYTVSQIGFPDGFDLLTTVDAQTALYIQGLTSALTAAINAQVGVKPYMTQQLADNINAILTDL